MTEVGREGGREGGKEGGRKEEKLKCKVETRKNNTINQNREEMKTQESSSSVRTLVNSCRIGSTTWKSSI